MQFPTYVEFYLFAMMKSLVSNQKDKGFNFIIGHAVLSVVKIKKKTF